MENKWKSYVMRESHYDEETGLPIDTKRTLNLLDYQSIFRTIDNESHELLINEVKSNNDRYDNAKSGIYFSPILFGIGALILYLVQKNFSQVNDSLFLNFYKSFLYLLSAHEFMSAIYYIISGIKKLINNKEVVEEGNEFMAINYPKEYKKVNPIKSLRKVKKEIRSKKIINEEEI